MTEVLSKVNHTNNNINLKSDEDDDSLNPAFKEWSNIYSAIEFDPDSFNLWEDLLEEVENLEGGLCKASSTNAIKLFRFTYDSFLERFPLVYGYWIKYANLEFNLGNTEIAVQIYERAVGIIPLSVELWTSFVTFKVTVCPSLRDIRNLFKRAAKIVGHHYLSHTFWDKYIELETQRGDDLTLYNLYITIIQIPLHQYSRYFASLLKLLPQIPVDKLTSPEYLTKFKQQYIAYKESLKANKPEIKDEKIKEKKEGEEDDDEKEKSEEEYIRSCVFKQFVAIFHSTHKRSIARWPYESEIQRPYFHVLYLPEEECVNWRRYLQFIEIECSNDDSNNNNSSSLTYSSRFQDVITLYERAIIPFGHYEEFWLRYTRWLIAHKMISDARNVYRRACYILPIGRIQVRLQYALFEESLGNFEFVKDSYLAMLQSLPSSTEIILAYVNFLHRTEGASQALSYLESKINEYRNVQEKLKQSEQQQQEKPSSTSIDQSKSTNNNNNVTNKDESSPLLSPGFDADLPALVVALAENYFNWTGNLSKTRSIYSSYTKLFEPSHYFWKNYLNFEINISLKKSIINIFQDSTILSQAPENENEEEHKENVGETFSPNYHQVNNVYTQIKASTLLSQLEKKDLSHIYMVYLLSSDGQSGKQSTLEYFQIDREIHK